MSKRQSFVGYNRDGISMLSQMEKKTVKRAFFLSNKSSTLASFHYLSDLTYSVLIVLIARFLNGNEAFNCKDQTKWSTSFPVCVLVCLTLSVNKVASGYSLRVTMLTLLKKQIITQSILQFSLIFCMHKDKGDCPGCPARVNEMMETQRPGHVDWGDGDVCVSLGEGQTGRNFQKGGHGFKCSIWKPTANWRK